SLAVRGLALLREAGEKWVTAKALCYLGGIRRQQGQLTEARAILEECVALCQEHGGLSILVIAQSILGRLMAKQGDLTTAQALYQQNMPFVVASGRKPLIADYLEGRGAVEAASGESEKAALLWGSAEALRESGGTPMFPATRQEYDQAVAVAR